MRRVPLEGIGELMEVGQRTVRRKWMYAPDTVGDSWTIVIERDGREVGTERVRGWRASERRMDEIRRSR